MSRRGCFECDDMGHFVRDYPKLKRAGYISVRRLQLLGLHNLHPGELYRVVDMVLIQVEVVLLMVASGACGVSQS